MFGPLGVPELLFILALALLIFGPRKLPEIGRTLGKGMAEFRKASNELKRTLNAEVIREEIRQNDPRRILREAVEETEADEAKPDTKSPETAAKKPAAPAGTVSRSSGDAPGTASAAPPEDEVEASAEDEVEVEASAEDEVEASAEPASDSRPSPST